ncbi:MAG: ABC transporter ATP-binding protein, partial [Clostridia bacterium]|nr:ABC transporter ATP-binding protein [Clostridia bacterium]
MEEKKKPKKEKEEKRKAKYGTLTCIRWLMTRMWQWEKWIVLASFLIILPAVALHACGLYLPSIILDSLETSEHFNQVALTVVALVAAQLFFTILRQMMEIYRRTAGRKCSTRFYYELMKKTADLDYYHRYDVEYKTLKDRAGDVLGRGGDGSPGDILIDLSKVIINAACFLIFGSIISMLSPWIIALLVLGSLVNLLLKKWKQDRDWQGRDERNANGRKINYLSWWLSNTPKAGKDIRLYNLTPFLDEKGHELVDEHIRLTRKTQNTGTVVKVVNLAIAALRDGLAYLFVILGTVNGSVSASEAVLYFTAISQMSGFIDGILGYFNKLHQSHLMVSDCIEYLDESRDRLNRGPGIPLPQGRPLSIEFRNVSYKYPEGEKNVIDHVSFKIEAGEKISLVG